MKISLFIQLIVYLVYGVPLKIINIKTGWTIGAAGNIVVDDATPTTVWNVGTISGPLPYYIYSNTQGTYAYLNVYSALSTSLARIGLWTAGVYSNQQWSLNRISGNVFQIQAYQKTMCFHVTALYVTLDQYTCSGLDPQTLWNVSFAAPVTPLVYLTSILGNVLQVASSGGSGAQVQTTGSFDGSVTQTYGLQLTSSTVWSIYNAYNFLAVKSSGSSGTSVTLNYDIAVYGSNPSSNLQWIFTMSSDQCSFMMQSAATSTLCLQDMGPGLSTQLQPCSPGLASQLWKVQPVQNSVQWFAMDSGDSFALLNPSVTGSPLTGIQYSSCAMSQYFVFNAYNQLQSILNGQCVSVLGSSTSDGAVIDMENCDSRLDQKLSYDPISTYITFVHSAKCVTYMGRGLPLQQFTCDGRPGQNWTTNLSATRYVSVNTTSVNLDQRSSIVQSKFSFTGSYGYVSYDLTTLQKSLNNQTDYSFSISGSSYTWILNFGASLNPNLNTQCSASISVGCQTATNFYSSIGAAATQSVTVLTAGIGPTCGSNGVPCGLLIQYTGGTLCGGLTFRSTIYYMYCDLSLTYGSPVALSVAENPTCVYTFIFLAAEACNGTIGAWTSTFSSTITKTKTTTTRTTTTTTNTVSVSKPKSEALPSVTTNLASSEDSIFGNTTNLILVIVAILMVIGASGMTIYSLMRKSKQPTKADMTQMNTVYGNVMGTVYANATDTVTNYGTIYPVAFDPSGMNVPSQSIQMGYGVAPSYSFNMAQPNLNQGGFVMQPTVPFPNLTGEKNGANVPLPNSAGDNGATSYSTATFDN